MICVLEGWVPTILTLLVLVAGVTMAVIGVRRLADIGARRHPRMDPIDSRHRRTWESDGMLVGVIAFFVITSIFAQALRPVACDLFGTWQPAPIYSLP